MDTKPFEILGIEYKTIIGVDMQIVTIQHKETKKPYHLFLDRKKDVPFWNKVTHGLNECLRAENENRLK